MAGLRFGVIGVDHPHIFSMTQQLREAGAELAGIAAREHGLAEAFCKAFSDAPRVEARALLEDASVGLIAGAGIPDERARVGIDAMRHGKDYLVDKPGMTTLAQLGEVKAVARETGRFFQVFFSERLENPATVRAGELVAAGAIGRVLQTVGLGPHRLNAGQRPAWFFERERYGGILCDIGSHQADQFLYFTGCTNARVVASRVANHAHPEHPGLEDFGEMLLEGDGATGYVRVDWFTPDGLPTWGDGRLTILGSEGTLEIRKEIDLDGREGRSHLLLVDAKGVQRVACGAAELPFARQLIADLRDRSETAMSQEHCFRACELVLQAQAQAVRVQGRS